jgi:hypothetical protein
MTALNTIVPFATSAVSFIFAYFVFKRYLYKKNPYVLLWGIGLVFYGISGFSAGYYGAFGWNQIAYRLWYLLGAMLVAAWLGQGTVYLLAKRKWADVLMGLLFLGSLFGTYRVFSAELDPSLLTTSERTGIELSGHAIVTEGVRILTPLFNVYGTVALVGGALYSSWIFWRKRVLLHRTIGNILIASGAMVAATGGTFSRFGVPAANNIGIFIGVILMFIGFVRATTPMGEALQASVSQSAD